MSSGFAHCFVGASIGQSDKLTDQELKFSPAMRWLWTGWGALNAMAPDLDYIIPVLNASAHDGKRVTHSLIMCGILPLLTTIVLLLCKLPSRAKRMMIAQVFAAGYSHMVMDLLVGVTSFPLWWPLSTQMYKSPVGFLPSSPGYYLRNLFLYRNVLIEGLIFIPAMVLPHVIHRRSTVRHYRWWLIGLGCLLLIGLIWGVSLAR